MLFSGNGPMRYKKGKADCNFAEPYLFFYTLMVKMKKYKFL